MASIEKIESKKGGVTYRIKVSLGYDDHNKQIVERTSYKPERGMTERQIQKELNRIAVLFETNCKQRKEQQANAMRASSITFQQLADEWLALVETTKEQKPSSLERLKGCKERTYRAIGTTRIDKVSFRQIQNFIVSLSENGTNQTTGGGLSEKTQKHYLCFISDVMRYAIQCGLISTNPCRNISVVKTDRSEKDIYSLDEVKLILSHIKEKATTDYCAFFFLTAYLGLRRGEVLGLEYKDFDFGASTVSIRRTSNYQKASTGIYTGTPKTKTSCRTLFVPEIVLSLVRKLQTERAEQKEKCGDLWNESDRLFVTWCGNPMHPNTPYTWLERFCDKYNLPFKGLHSFRHTFATQAITSGTDIATVASILGHSQTSTTLNLYTHAVQEANVKAVCVVSDLLNQSGESE